MRADYYVRLGKQQGQNVVLYGFLRFILEEIIGFFLVNVKSRRAEFSAVYRRQQRKAVDQSASRRVDEYR